MTTVTWVQDVNGNYEISSVNHLLQLMHEGSLFTDSGTAPSVYLSGDYIQTTDIDLINDSVNIQPIGHSAGVFDGKYDGQNYKISNWSYNSGASFFNNCNGATLQNMTLDGVWILTNGSNNCAFIAGVLFNSFVYNITTNFSAGTSITGSGSLGVVSGYTVGTSGSNITVGGIIDNFTTNSSADIGGVFGWLSGSGSWSHVRNIATFTNGISGGKSGGISGNIQQSCSYFMNAMTGNIYGSTRSGGISGRQRSSSSDMVIAMKGNITGGIPGALFSELFLGQTITRGLNYMDGDVSYGLIGNQMTSCTISKCVVASKGTVTGAAIQSNTGSTEILLDISNGLVASSTANTISTMDLTSFDSIDSSTGLPILSFLFTDPIGNSIDWPFVFGFQELFDLTSNPINVFVNFVAVSGAVAYRITIEENTTGSDVTTVQQGFTETSLIIPNLVPSVEYLIKLYSTSDNSTYSLSQEGVVSTLSNIGANWNLNDLENTDGDYDISTSQEYLSIIADEVFSTGDIVIIKTANGKIKKTTFLQNNESIDITQIDALMIPFDTNNGVSQNASVVLSNSSTVVVTYDETNETIVINGETYSPGDTLILDGKKVTIEDV